MLAVDTSVIIYYPIVAPVATVPVEEAAPVALLKALSVVDSTVGVPGNTPGEPGVIVGYSYSMSCPVSFEDSNVRIVDIC